jgi:hypothetical protein
MLMPGGDFKLILTGGVAKTEEKYLWIFLKKREYILQNKLEFF